MSAPSSKALFFDFIVFVSKFISADHSAISMSPMADFMWHNDSISKKFIAIILESFQFGRSRPRLS